MPTAFSPPPALPLQWLDLHGDVLYRYALSRVRRPETAEDLVQETLLSAMKSADRFAGRSGHRTWLTGILRNKINDHFRARYRRPEPEQSPLEEEGVFDRRGRWKKSVTRWDGDPAAIAESAEFRQVLDGCIARLPTRMAHLLLSRVADGIETQTLCNDLGINAQNVWTILHRARSRLRQCLTERWFNDPSAGEKNRRMP